MNNNFSCKRFAYYAKSEIIVNRRVYILCLGVLAAILLTPYYINNLNMQDAENSERVMFQYSLIMPRQLCIFIIGFLTIINASISFRTYFHKGLSSAALMLPVSKVEKFSYALLLNIILIPFVMVVMLYIIDCGYTFYFNTNWWLLTYLSLYIKDWNTGFIMLLSGAMIMSIYFFGAIRFRRFQFLITSLLMFLFWMLLIITLVNFGNDMDLWFSEYMSWVDITKETIEIIVSGIIILVITLFTVLAWKRFNKFQIIK